MLIQIGQKVRHANFKGIGTVVQLFERESRLAADFPGTNGIIDDARHFKLAGIKVRKTKSSHLLPGEYSGVNKKLVPGIFD